MLVCEGVRCGTPGSTGEDEEPAAGGSLVPCGGGGTWPVEPGLSAEGSIARIADRKFQKAEDTRSG